MRARADRAFLPICSYTNRLRTRSTATRMLSLLLSRFSEILILVADSLQEINLRRKGLSQSVAVRNSSIDAANMISMYESILRAEGWTNVRVVRMSEVIATPELANLREPLLRILYQQPEFAKEARRFVSWASRRFGWLSEKDSKTLETTYLHAEILVSIYVTEVLGYNCEIWEKLPGWSSPDPLAAAYKVAARPLCELLHKEHLDRTLIALEEVEEARATNEQAVRNLANRYQINK